MPAAAAAAATLDDEGAALSWFERRGYDVRAVLEDIHGERLTPSSPDHTPAPLATLIATVTSRAPPHATG
jgi:hypothetical protein